MDLDCQSLDLFDPAGLADEIEGFARQARAYKSVARVQPRRAKSEAMLREILPPTFTHGESWHVLTAGDVDALSYAAHILRDTTAAYMAFSTWCLATADIEQMSAWLTSRKVARIDAYVGEIFPGSYPSELRALKKMLSDHGAGRVCPFRNHSKVFLIATPTQRITVESSANINTNPRCENACITVDDGLFLHHKSYFDSVRCADPTYTDWSPWTDPNAAP